MNTAKVDLESNLTEKQADFVERVLRGDRVVDTSGFKSIAVQKAIAARLDKISIQDAIDKKALIDRFWQIANATPADFGEWDRFGNFRLDPETVKTKGHLIQSIKRRRSGEIEITLIPKIPALQALAQYMNLYEAHNQSLSEPLARAIEAIIRDNKPDDVIALARQAVQTLEIESREVVETAEDP